MRTAKLKLILPGLILGLAMSASAFDGKGEKKTPKKPDPPVVIVNLDKKKNEKPKEESENKKAADTVSLIFSLIDKFD